MTTMSNGRVEIVICLGSSCFARGNKNIVQEIKKFLEENNLMHKVTFRGKHCFGKCENGPSLTIGEKKFELVTLGSIREVLENELL
jgi:NADH:ubiquinone oxidoreductase subunit E